MKTSCLTTLAGVATLSSVPSVALAHPDHAAAGSHGLAHLVLDPFHLMALAGAFALAFAVAHLTRRRAAGRSTLR